MYKRRARILFLATDPADAACACAAARELGPAWVDALTVPDDGPVDLIVSLDPDAACRLPPGHVPHKHWPVTAPRADDIRQRVAGLVGGMRLLASLDGSGPPADAPGAGQLS